MHKLPPSPKDKEKAIDYIKGLRRKDGENDFDTVRSAISGAHSISYLMLGCVAIMGSKNLLYTIPVTVFSLYTFLLAYKLEQLMGLFDGKDLNTQ